MNKYFKRIVMLVITALLFIPFVKVNAETITNINITGVSKPVIGEHPSLEGISITTPGVTIASIQWDDYINSTCINESETFLATKYGLYITFELSEGYTLGEGFTVSVNAEYEDLNYRGTDYFYLVYTAKHLVRFETNGGDAKESLYVADGELAVRPNFNPKKQGFTFAGWYADEELENPYDFSTPVTESKTIYAKWTPKTLLSEVNITSEVTGVAQGNLLPFEVETTTEHVEIEPFGSNTTWMKWATGMSSWHGFGGENSIAIEDGTTHYALRVKLEVDSNYYMNNTTKIYFNGVDVTGDGYTTLDSNFDWGGYAYIDLGLAAHSETEVYTVSFNMNGVVASAIPSKYVVAGSLVMPPEEPSSMPDRANTS